MDLPWTNLQTLIHDWMKGLQQIVDAIAPDPGEDNSMLNLQSLPYKFDGTFYSSITTNDILDGWSGWDKGYGAQAWLFTYRVNLMNNRLTVPNQHWLGGKAYPSQWWDYVNDSDYATINAAGEALIENNSIEFTNNYSTAEIKVKCDMDGGMYFLPFLHSETDIKFKYPIKNDGSKSTSNSRFTSYTPKPSYDDVNGVWTPSRWGEYGEIPARPMFCPLDTVIIVFDNYNDAYYCVNINLAPHSTHNDVLNYTEPNREYKLYYGDNYLVYVLDPLKNYNYQDIYTGTNQATNTINGWNPSSPTIKTPTYQEVKHEDDPPPTPLVTDDDYVDMGLGVETDGMAMYNMAVITRDDLIQLITDFEANADTGLSFIPHVLGLYKLGIESSQLLTTKSEQIRLHKEPNGTSAFTSVDSYNIVKDQLTVIDCGSITVDREELLTNTFYDYSPYSTYEMFIPGCGWITLPDTIVGRTISVSIVFDLTTCSCKGVVRTEGKLLGGSGTTIATVNGIIGSSVPLSINETGLQRAAIFNGSTQAAMALGTAFFGVGIGNPYMGASGVAMAAGALADNHVAGNTTYTNTKGGATDYSVFGDGYKAVLKITRPVVEIPDNYGHTVGFVVNEYGMLSDFHGFTVCVNPHIHIPATSDEKEEIKRLLESGVILPEEE